MQDYNGQVHIFIVFKSTMEEFLDTPEEKELMGNLDELEDFLLNQSRIRVIVCKDSDVVSQMEKLNWLHTSLDSDGRLKTCSLNFYTLYNFKHVKSLHSIFWLFVSITGIIIIFF